MNIEKRNVRAYNILIIVVLVAILLTAGGGYMMQRQTGYLKDNMGMSRSGSNPMMQPELAQTGPTGKLVMSTGIVLLLVGFGVIVVMLWAGRFAHRNPS